MGSGKRSHGRNAKPQTQLRSRQTRSSKGRLLTDPAANTQLLTEQLRSLGLYAAPTLGDGNCLFRALSDQLYGSPSHHLQLRADICDWIGKHKVRYAPFVEDERGLDVHLRCMRENATYGGHLELSAFAHLTRRNVKVIQPGLVYVIEWDAGGDPSSPPASPMNDDPMLDDRERRRLRRDKRRAEKAKAVSGSGEDDENTREDADTIYVAYHDWEHFSSIRNLKGPHAGLPHVSEIDPSPESTTTPPRPKKPKPKSKAKGKTSPIVTTLTPPTPVVPPSSSFTFSFNNTLDDPPTPSQIPLPASRSPSPSPLTAIPPPASSTHISPMPNRKNLSLRIHQSPKRSFDESSGSGSSQTSSESVAKRTRSSRSRPVVPDIIDVDVDVDDSNSTPGLSGPGSSSSSASSPSPPPPPPPRPLTRRQRKAQGLPKTRSGRVVAGRIVIPGGRMTGTGRVDDEVDEDGEWRRNGTGRVDVRGFRELKI